MTRDEMQEIAELAAQKAVRNLMMVFGADPADPRSVLDLQADIAHLRNWRKAAGQVQRVGTAAAISVITSGALAAAWVFVQTKLGGR